jgi:hypothetical protein
MDSELNDRLDKLDLRKLVMFNIFETRANRKLLNNHLRHHEENIKIANERRWKVYLLLAGCFLTTVGGMAVAPFAFLL